MNSKQSLILITGGHLTPALAVLSELKKRGYSHFLWVGHKYNQAGTKEHSNEFKNVSELNIPFIELKTGKLIRNWGFDTFVYGLKQFFWIFGGFFKALWIIIRYRPKLILSFGGYLAVPVAVLGKLFGAKVITHEQTIVAGLANRIIAKFADKILISWESSKKYFNPKKTVLTGNPIRREIFTVKSDTLTRYLDKNLPILLIMGGNQGSHEINKRIFAILDLLLKECNVIHQTGNSSVTGDYQKGLELKESLSHELENRYIVRDFIGADEIGEALNEANLVFARSGANQSSEFLALGKLAILMPLPKTSHDEARQNAKLVESTGLGYVLEQKDNLSAETVYQTILLGLNQLKTGKGFNSEDIESCKENARNLVLLDAPMNVADEVEKLVLSR